MTSAAKRPPRKAAPRKKSVADKAPPRKTRTAAGRQVAAKPAPSKAARASAKPAKSPPKSPPKPALRQVIVAALEDMNAHEIKVLDVRGLTDVADFMIIASGTSDRHVRSVAERVVEKTKAAGFRPHGVEGRQDSDWVLIDLSEIIVHVMLPRAREFYGLEKLWDMTAAKRAVTRA